MVGPQPGWELLTGQTQQEYQDYGWSNAVHPEDMQPTIVAWEEAVSNKQIFIFQHRLKLASGEWGHFSIRALPLFEADGSIREWVGVHTDITKQKVTQIILEENNAELLRINNELDNFIYTASHDLKSPVANIEGLIHALKEHFVNSITSDDEILSLIDMIDTSILRFKGTILDLTEISKLQAPIESELEPIDLKDLVNDVLLSIQDLVVYSQANIITRFEAIPSLNFSKKNLRSIVYNLLSNSMKYKDENKETWIIIETQQLDEYIVLTCSDNGLGISKINQKRMFTMFKRFHNHVEGTGVGLYIVKKIVDNAGGKIEVESEEGIGTTFKVYFKR